MGRVQKITDMNGEKTRNISTGLKAALSALLLMILLSSCTSGDGAGGSHTQGDGDADSEQESASESDAEIEAEADTCEDELSETNEAEETDIECPAGGFFSGEVSTDAYGIDWVSIPAGCFIMGCAENDSACFEREKPRHPVKIENFRISASEITQAQYLAVTGENPSANNSCSNCPVERVTWAEARAFCRAVAARLPSEAEWEYAARAGTQSIFYCGDDSACLEAAAWYEANSEGRTHPVGMKEPNAFGLYDTMGNVLEWVEDCIHDNYSGAPGDGSAWVDSDCVMRVLRGGSCFYLDRGLRLSNRMWTFTSLTRSHFAGFRCVQDEQ